RHTRFDCDWSSDVCSSDLLGPQAEERQRLQSDLDLDLGDPRLRGQAEGQLAGLVEQPRHAARLPGQNLQRLHAEDPFGTAAGGRSEERRVGKGWRAWWASE